jgi:hypothetical protein
MTTANSRRALKGKDDVVTSRTPYRHDSTGDSYVDGLEEKPDELLSDSFIRDPFRPFDDLPEEKHWVMTWRAMFIGLCCGALVNASNVYLGLKSGWTFGANLFGVSGKAKFCNPGTDVSNRPLLVLLSSSSSQQPSRRISPSSAEPLVPRRTISFRRLPWPREAFPMSSFQPTLRCTSSSCLTPPRMISGALSP